MAVKKALRFNKGKPRYSLVKLSCLEPLAEVLDYGRIKYSKFKSLLSGEEFYGYDLSEEQLSSDEFEMIFDARDNWNDGLVLSEVLDSLMRHVSDMQDGKIIDEESKKSLIGHIQANALFLGSKNIINDIKGG